MKKDLSFVAFITLCLIMGLTLGACGSKDNNGNNGNNGTITTANNQPNFDCLTRGINCNTFNTTNGFGPTFWTNGSSANFQTGICACSNRAGYEMVAYVDTNGITRYSCVPSSTVNGNGGFVLSWSFSNRNKSGSRRRGKVRRRRNRNGVNVNVISNHGQGRRHSFHQNNSGTCQQSIAQSCFRDRPCRQYIRNGQRGFCSNGGNRNVRGVCVF